MSTGKTIGRFGRVAACGVVAWAFATAPAPAQDEPETGWSDTAEVALFASAGNTEVQTISLRNTASRRWTDSALEIALGAVRSETTTTSRTAVGDPLSFTLRETSDSELTAENYFLRARYDRDVHEKLFWFAGLGWERNEFSGISNRSTALAGLGRVWVESEGRLFRTDAALTYTDQEDVSGESREFAGLRLSYRLEHRLNESTSVVSALSVDENLDDTSDYRADFENSLAVSMSERLALKVSLQLLYDNQPAFGQVPLIGIDGSPTGNSVAVALDELDSTLTVSLVADF